MADGLQDVPRHAGQVVRRVLLRRNIAIDAETAQLVANAVQAALRAGTPSQPPRRRGRVPPAGCVPCSDRAGAGFPAPTPGDGAPGVAAELSRPGRGPVTLPSPDNLADHLHETTLPQVSGPGTCASDVSPGVLKRTPANAVQRTDQQARQTGPTARRLGRGDPTPVLALPRRRASIWTRR